MGRWNGIDYVSTKPEKYRGYEIIFSDYANYKEASVITPDGYAIEKITGRSKKELLPMAKRIILQHATEKSW